MVSIQDALPSSKDGAKAFGGVVGVVITVAVVSGILAVFGVTLTGRTIAILFAGVVLFAAWTQQTAEISAGFVIIGISILLVITEYLVPSFLKSPFEPLVIAVRENVGISIPAIGDNAVSFLVIAIAVVFVSLYAKIRLSAERRGEKSAFDLALSRLTGYTRTYAVILRLLVVFIIGVIITIIGQFGPMFGQIGNLIGEAPVVASNLVVAGLGYLSLGGTIPWLGDLGLFNDLTAFGFLVLSLGIIAIAAMSKFDAGGPLSQILER